MFNPPEGGISADHTTPEKKVTRVFFNAAQFQRPSWRGAPTVFLNRAFTRMTD
jgi:hypothetical protein